MRRLTAEQRRKELESLAAIPDDQIDLSDIPEVTEEQLRSGVRGLYYRPIKKSVTMRLDADVIAWLKQEGPGYQTKANRLLRTEMCRSLGLTSKPTNKRPMAKSKKAAKRQKSVIAGPS